MKLWEEQGSSWNFQQKLQLMLAEEHYSIGNYNSAKENYNNAIHTARSHKFVNDEALSCELAARFYLETGNIPLALEHFNLAHKKYIDWGAVGKANSLFAYTSDTFASILGNI
jgi:tetratricopeptide (TPR) repeat protein